MKLQYKLASAFLHDNLYQISKYNFQTKCSNRLKIAVVYLILVLVLKTKYYKHCFNYTSRNSYKSSCFFSLTIKILFLSFYRKVFYQKH